MFPPDQSAASSAEIVLIGAGVVGTAIAHAHLDAGIDFTWLDKNESILNSSLDTLRSQFSALQATPRVSPIPGSFAIRVTMHGEVVPLDSSQRKPVLVLESILERLDAKQALVDQVFQAFGPEAIFASNTSSLRIRDLANQSRFPDRVCGMHFFMPVHQRPLIEIIASDTTSSTTLDQASLHAKALKKGILLVKDSPGFVVNRMLWPYLNQSIAMLGAGIDHERIRAAALCFGMPMSPLELIDWIGLRTAFDSGRIAWQAFPKRIEPSPILPGMLKAGAAGRTSGSGFYEYSDTTTGPIAPHTLTQNASNTIAKYQDKAEQWSDHQIYLNLAIPIWIEASLILREGLVENFEQIEIALAGGLGFTHPNGFWKQMSDLAAEEVSACIRLECDRFKAMSAPQGLITELASATNPVIAVERWLSSPHKD